jgi:hypothetical protein
LRTLDALPEERLYQVLDYVEFLGSKYARENRKNDSPLRRFGEKLEDHMRINGVAMGAIRGTMDVVGTADKVFSDVAQAGMSFFREVEAGLKAPSAPSSDAESGRKLPSQAGGE